ncbi:MAG: 23S rRNA (uracil(1939)-C(5))-methyltransferase RlmD [Phascolarctobacterium sp.]|nr:23S rRNA (uracil(1939)-C(5))-methyltransferase RlmD [Phascolarctobacterium sp.]
MKANVPVQKGDIIEMNITGLGSSGEGVGKFQGFTVFVNGALPTETIKAKVGLVKKSYATARIVEILQASAERVEPACPVYKECGGCQLQHLSYAGQLQMKEQQVRDAVTRIGHLDTEVMPVIGCANPWNYRNKMQFPAAMGAEGKIEIGCYATATHSVVDTEGCLIQKEANNQVLFAVRKWMQQFNITAYDEKTGKGLVRHVMSRVGVHSGEVMAVLITSAYDIPCKKELVDILKKEVPGLVSVVQNINKKPTNIIMGNKTHVIYGKPNIKDSLGALSFNVSAQSFFQVNSEQAEKLYNKALEYAALTGSETVVDVYCGTGTISLYMAKHAKKVYGIEIVAPAIEDAKKNVVANGCANAEFILGDAAVELPALLESGVSPDVVLLDPPRAGCEEKVLAAICKVKPERIVYVSCNPASLARDLAYLEEHGYKATVVQPIDMFAATSHIENVALIVRE